MDPFYRLIDFETVADSSAASAGDPAGGDLSPTDPAATVGGAQAGESESPSADATGPAPAGTPQYDFTDPVFVDGIQGLLEQQLAPFQEVAQLLQQQLYGQNGQQQPQYGQPQYGQPQMPDLDLDPLDDSFKGNLLQVFDARDQRMLAAMQQMMGQIAQPLQEQQQAQRTAEGNQRIADIIADEARRNGDFPRVPGESESKTQNLVRTLADAMAPELVQRYGENPRTAEMAINQATATVREIVAEVRAATEAEVTNRLATLAGAPREPGGAAVAAQHGGIRARTIDEGLSAVTARHAAALRGA